RNDDVIELDNGCICCTIGGALVDALTRVAARRERPDVLLIEASGVSDPAKIAQIGLLNGAFRLTSVLVVADATSLMRTLVDPLVGALAQRQIDGAGAIIVTKLDLLAPEARERALADVSALAPTDVVVPAKHGRVPPALLFDTAAPDRRTVAPGDRWRRPRGAASMPAFSSVTVSTPEILDKLRFRAWLKTLPRAILRAKGIVRVADATGVVSTRICQVAARRFRLSSPDGCHDPSLYAEGVMVFIGIIDPGVEALLQTGLTACRKLT
ncbi:MAG: CobW family GTP-binding protein, partial [Trinickia sp.]